MSIPPLSVVVPTKDPWPGLKDCLDALLDQVAETGAELIVVDGSGEGLPADEASPYRRVKLVRAFGESVFALRVRGVDAARGDLLAVTEDHCLVDGGWCAEIIEAHRRRPEAAAIAGAIENGSTGRFMDWANFLMTFSPFMAPIDRTERHRIPPPPNVSYKRSVIEGRRLEGGSAEFELNPALAAAGLMELDDRVALTHVQSLGVAGTMASHFHNGRSTTGMAHARSPWSSRRTRLRSYLNRPVSLARHTLRSVRRRDLPIRARLSLPLVVVLCLCHAAGELTGIATGGAGQSPEAIG